MTELGNHHLTVLYEFTDPDTEHLWLPKYKKRGNWTLCAFGLKKKKKPPMVLPKGSNLSLAKPLGPDSNFQKYRGQRSCQTAKYRAAPRQQSVKFRL